MEANKYQKRMFENIYDLIKGCFTTRYSDDDYWTELNRKHEQEAKKELNRFIHYKTLEWDGDNHRISIGKRFTIELKIR